MLKNEFAYFDEYPREDPFVNHFIEKCIACKRTIYQCRCPVKNKTVRWSTCPECAGLCGN